MSKYKILSLDIWDTVLRRKCHPDESKLFVCRYILLKHYKGIEDVYRDLYLLAKERVNSEIELATKYKKESFDDEYHIEEVFDNWLGKILKESYSESLDIKDLIKELISIELNHEKYITYLDPNILSIIKQYDYEKCVYISDFYGDSSFIDEILREVKCPINFEKGFVSCDYKLNKKSGRLFKEVHNILGIKPDEHIHIGDNIKSDVKIPSQIGIKSYHYQPKIEVKNKEVFESQYNFRKDSIKNYYEKLLDRLLNISDNKFDSNEQKELYRLGKKYSIVFFTFIFFIIEDVIKNDGETVYYFTREGEFFKQIHDKILENNPLGVDIPKGKILEVSRMATFTPSLREITIEEMKRLWNQYHEQSVKTLFKTLNIDDKKYAKYFEKYDIDINEDFEIIYENSKIIDLFNDNKFISDLSKEINIKKSNLTSYFTSKGIDNNTDNMFIVDIGWRGSIQDNIACIYDKKKIQGYYFGIFESLNKVLSNTKKKGFVSKEMCEDRMWIFKYVDPFEMLCNSPTGTTISYEYNEQNEIYAVRGKAKEEDIIFDQYIKYFQNGVLDSIEDICEFVRIHSFMFDDLKKIAYDNLEEIMTNPKPILAKAYFNLSHNETFGLGKYISKKSSLDIFTAMRGVVSKTQRQKYLKHVIDTHWPQGFFNYYKLPMLTKCYNNLVKDKFVDSKSLTSLDTCRLVDIQIPEESNEIKYYFDSINNNGGFIEIRGWAIIPKIDSKKSNIYILIIYGDNKLIYETFSEVRKDITECFNDGCNYDNSGFLAKIDLKVSLNDPYRVGLLVINDKKKDLVISNFNS